MCESQKFFVANVFFCINDKQLYRTSEKNNKEKYLFFSSKVQRTLHSFKHERVRIQQLKQNMKFGFSILLSLFCFRSITSSKILSYTKCWRFVLTDYGELTLLATVKVRALQPLLETGSVARSNASFFIYESHKPCYTLKS